MIAICSRRTLKEALCRPTSSVIGSGSGMRIRWCVATLATFSGDATRALRAIEPQPDVVAGFGALGPPGAVLWVQSVHAAWLEISQRRRSLPGRLKQCLNPAHPYILHRERRCFGQRQYSKLIALSPTVKADLMRFYDVPDDDIDILPNGFSTSEFNVRQRLQDRDQRRAELGYRDSDQVVIFVANELERKGFGPLLRAIAAINRPNVHLLAVGNLNQNAYASEIGSLGMRGRVRFTGPTNNVARFYAAADLFALPTYNMKPGAW